MYVKNFSGPEAWLMGFSEINREPDTLAAAPAENVLNQQVTGLPIALNRLPEQHNCRSAGST